LLLALEIAKYGANKLCDGDERQPAWRVAPEHS
jgi:hypothetical protein